MTTDQPAPVTAADEETEGDQPIDATELVDDGQEVVEADYGPADDYAKWRDRAKAYNSQYKGPAHWVWMINVVSATGSIAVAMRETGISRTNINRRRERFPEFAEAFQSAMEYFREGTLERAAHTRAVDGVLEPVFYKGDRCGVVRKYSDTLLVKLLEANLPEKFRNKAENTAPGSITIIGGLPDDPEDEAPTTAPAAPATPETDVDPLA